jgi:putative Holliday junction resolvase
MRFLGVDYGARRVGLAVSDASATLARPWRVVPAGPSPAATAGTIEQAARDFLAEAGEDRFAGIVLGLPRRLNGDDTHQTPVVRQLAQALGSRGIPVYLQDERLSSRAADERLAERERDWRVRKRQLDAAAAAVILQDFLDGRVRTSAAVVQGEGT